MTLIQFNGWVFPPHTRMSLPSQMSMTCSAERLGTVKLSITIEKSKVIIDCDIDPFDDTQMKNYFVLAQDMAHSVVDLAAFYSGYRMNIVFDTWRGPDGKLVGFAFQEEDVKGICTAYTLKDGIDQAATLLINDRRLLHVFNDLVTSIGSPTQSVVNCVRALEGLRNLMADPKAKDEQAWEQMRAPLNVSRDYLKFITDIGRNPRHGRWETIEAPLTQNVQSRSWHIMNRYLEYRLRGDAPLSESEFPLL